MAEKWDFTKEDARICAKPLKQSSLLPLMSNERILKRGKPKQLLLSEDGDVSDHKKLSKLHRPTWVKELFFSQQASQKLSIKDACGWVMENMPSVFHPNGKPLTSSTKPLTSSTVCTWKKQLEKKRDPTNR